MAAERAEPDRGPHAVRSLTGTLIGNCLQALTRIDAVGSDFEMKTGFCGKSGQTAPVGTGQGHVRIQGMTVGGTAV